MTPQRDAPFRRTDLILLVALASVARIAPILNGTGWTDLYAQQAIPILEHRNIYEVTRSIFPYSPVSMFLPALCAKLTLLLHVPFSILMKLQSAAADVCIVAALYLVLAKKGHANARGWSLFYALNPVSILITGFHGNIISIATLSSFLAYAVLLFGVERHYRLSALLLGLGIGFRSYPVLFLPFFLIRLRLPFRKRMSYLLHATVPTALSFLPFLALDPRALLREVFTYSGATDYGLVALLRAVHSLKGSALLYGLPGGLHVALSGVSKYVFFAAYAVLLALAPRRQLIVSIASTVLLFYCVVAGISSQYLLWLLPFAFLIRGRMPSLYVGAATWALVNFYWLYHPQILFGRFPVVRPPLRALLTGEVMGLSLLWIVCLAWLLRLSTRGAGRAGEEML